MDLRGASSEQAPFNKILLYDGNDLDYQLAVVHTEAEQPSAV